MLLLLFPVLLLFLVYAFFYIFIKLTGNKYVEDIIPMVNESFLTAAPYVILIVGIWFIIAYFSNTYIIKKATGSEALSRKDNKRVYNLVENLCMSIGMPMPKINIIHDDSLNAFASGISNKTYTITLTQGIIDSLDDEELEGVIAHELSHIRNNDVRLLIISIVFVGIFSFLMQMAFQSMRYSSYTRSSKKDKGGGLIIILIILLLAAIGYFFSTLFKFSISQKREYLADACASEMTRKPQALASALRKISGNSHIEGIKQKDVAQLFIDNSGKNNKFSISSLFATHPPIENRIQVLEQF